MDSPGFSAKYCTYLGIDEQTEEILAMETLDKRDIDLKSTSMEKEGSELRKLQLMLILKSQN